MEYKISITTPQEAELVEKADLDGFIRWNEQFTVRNPYIIGYNHFMSENQVQWGHRPGINTGQGLHEGRMSANLFMALAAKGGPFEGNPDWFKDDKLFYKFLREHPELDSRPGKHKSQGAQYAERFI